MYNPFSLEGKSILITGASSGIGKSIAIECSKMGAKLLITGRNEERLNETFQALSGVDHLQIAGDLRDSSFMAQLVEFSPALNGLVNCAGIVLPIPFKFATKEKLNEILEINFEVPALLTQSLLKKQKIAKQASIVFISSVSGVLCAAYGNSLYSASKGAINGLAKGMALDLSPSKIRVNTVIPGMIETDLVSKKMNQEEYDKDVADYPLKRHGKPEEVAYATIYLLSDAAAWITGSNLLIDGGLTLK